MSLMSDVPDGTVQEVLDWVGDDLARANAAYQVEVGGAGRTTLINRLEAIASTPPEEEPVPDENNDEIGAIPPPDLVLDTTANDTTVSVVYRADDDVEVPDHDDLNQVEIIEADPVDYFQVAGSPKGAVFSFNGAAYVLTASQVAS